MKDFLLKFFDITFWKFIIIGVVNTLFGTLVMFVAYNVFHLNYWISSASNYVFGSILSYFLNKHFTFKSTDKSFKSVLLFVINITLCYLIAYGVAQPLAGLVFSGFGKVIQDNISMFAGMCLFVGLNYIGQRFIVFAGKHHE